jgi:hypothetical protein
MSPEEVVIAAREAGAKTEEETRRAARLQRPDRASRMPRERAATPPRLEHSSELAVRGPVGVMREGALSTASVRRGSRWAIYGATALLALAIGAGVARLVPGDRDDRVPRLTGHSAGALGMANRDGPAHAPGVGARRSARGGSPSGPSSATAGDRRGRDAGSEKVVTRADPPAVGASRTSDGGSGRSRWCGCPGVGVGGKTGDKKESPDRGSPAADQGPSSDDLDEGAPTGGNAPSEMPTPTQTEEVPQAPDSATTGPATGESTGSSQSTSCVNGSCTTTSCVNGSCSTTQSGTPGTIDQGASAGASGSSSSQSSTGVPRAGALARRVDSDLGDPAVRRTCW